MGAPHGSGCEAVNDCSTPIAFSRNTGSTPGASKTFHPDAFSEIGTLGKAKWLYNVELHQAHPEPRRATSAWSHHQAQRHPEL